MQDLANERDERLVELAQSGDRSATEILLGRYKNAVRARARRYFMAGGEMEDLVEEGMIGLYRAIGAYSPKEGKSFKNFAYLIVISTLVDAVKRSSRYKNAPLNNYVSIFDSDFYLPSDDSPEDAVLMTEENSEFRVRLLKELSDFEYRVITMYLEGMSYRQICEVTGKSQKSVDNALARSKKKLQRVYLQSHAR